MRASLRRKALKVVRTPGGRQAVHRVKSRRSPDRCSVCGSELSGSRRLRPYGDMCPSCARDRIKSKVMMYVSKG